MSTAHNLKRGTSRVLSGFVTERVIFCYADGALLVTETCEYRGVRDQPKARHQLTPGTEVCWTWPEDADEFVEQLRARDCDDSRPISLSVGGRHIGDLDWGKPRNGHEAGPAIAATISKCREAGLDVVVDGMPAAYAPRAAARKRPSADEPVASEPKSCRSGERPEPASGEGPKPASSCEPASEILSEQAVEPAAASSELAASRRTSAGFGMPAPPTRGAAAGPSAGKAAPHQQAGPTPVTRGRLRPQRGLPEMSPFVSLNLSASPLSLGSERRR